MFEFFGKKIPKAETKKEIGEEFALLKKQLLLLKKDKHEKIPLDTFDYVAWSESKIQNVPLAELRMVE